MEPLYKDPSASIEDRVSDLLGRMTLDEKFTQLTMIMDFKSIIESIDAGTFPKDGFASSYISKYMPVEDIDRVQRYQIENTRLGIPFLMCGESVHGLMYTGATIFPSALGLGASFNTELVGEIAHTIGQEMRAVGVRQTYAPNIDISRDPRWGRVEENYGEDTYLTTRMAVSYVKAVQSHDVAATLKHYLAHGSPEGGINQAPTVVGERMVREEMLEPFRVAIQEADCMSVMPAYSELDGVPMHANRYWLSTVLRDEIGFKGYVVSDSMGIERIKTQHGVVETPLETGIAALRAGVDHEIPSAYGYNEELKQLVIDGEIPVEKIDTAVANLLRIKFRLGLFENPYVRKDMPLHTPEFISLARRTAHESTVLLKNNGILPLSKDVRKVAVVGPNAAFPRLGGYTPKGPEEYSVALLDAMKNYLGEDRIVYAKGCNVTTQKDLTEAIRAANAADVIVAVLGDNSSSWSGIGWGDDEGGNYVTSGEAFDSCTLSLPPVQKELLRAMKETGKPIVLVLQTGRPYCIGEECDLSDAVLEAWNPGEQGGNAICDLLFGDVNFSGKLPISFPKSIGMLPCYYNYREMARSAYHSPEWPQLADIDKTKENPTALFSFGYGLSYTTFAYRDLKVEGDTVSVTVENTGDRAGKEAVLMYLKHHYCPITRPVKSLRGFKKIELAPGESKQVEFTITDDSVFYIDENMNRVVGTGKFTVMIGDQSVDFTR